MAYVARVPEPSWLTRQIPDGWLLAVAVAAAALGLVVTAVHQFVGIAGLDHEVGQLYPLQRRVRELEDDIRAGRIRDRQTFESVGDRLRELEARPPVLVGEPVDSGDNPVLDSTRLPKPRHKRTRTR